MNTQLKVGDRVRLTGKWESDNIDICTVIEIDDTEPKYCVAENSWNLLWVKSDCIEPIQDTPYPPKWLPINRDNLYPDKVVAIDINDKESGVQCGILELYLCVDKIGLSVNGIVSYPYTHYIPLSDLLNLPIAE